MLGGSRALMLAFTRLTNRLWGRGGTRAGEEQSRERLGQQRLWEWRKSVSGCIRIASTPCTRAHKFIEGATPSRGTGKKDGRRRGHGRRTNIRRGNANEGHVVVHDELREDGLARGRQHALVGVDKDVVHLLVDR